MEWKGGVHELDAETQGAAAFRVPTATMKALGSGLTGAVRIVVGAESVRIGSMRLPRVDVAAEHTELLPVGAGPLEVLLMASRVSAARVADAGLEPAVAEARARLSRAAKEVASQLGWLGVDESMVAAWLEAHVGARASGERTFVIAGRGAGSGEVQLALFE